MSEIAKPALDVMKWWGEIPPRKIQKYIQTLDENIRDWNISSIWWGNKFQRIIMEKEMRLCSCRKYRRSFGFNRKTNNQFQLTTDNLKQDEDALWYMVLL